MKKDVAVVGVGAVGIEMLRCLKKRKFPVDRLAVFEANNSVTPETLVEARILRNTRKPVVILGNGDIDVALNVQVHRISKSARAKIEAAGGTVEIIPLAVSGQGA